MIPKPSMRPAAVDWIDTTKAYVSQQATKQYPFNAHILATPIKMVETTRFSCTNFVK